MANRIVRIGAFIAKDRTGKPVQVVVWSERETIPATFSSPAREEEIVQHLRTVDGLHVNREVKGKYEIVEMREPLTSDDPSAP